MAAHAHARLFLIRNPATRSAALTTISGLDLSRPWEVVVRPHQQQRSNAQNARYWSVLAFASQASGYTAEELHELCKRHVLGCERLELAGTVVEKPRSSAQLNTSDFCDYALQAEAWLAQELGLRLPAWGFE